MQYVTLGKTGLKISRVGFGGIPIQRTMRKRQSRSSTPLLNAE